MVFARVHVNGESSVDEFPDEFVIDTSHVTGSTVSVEVERVVGVSELNFHGGVVIEFEGDTRVELDEAAQLMGAGEKKGY